MSETGAVFPYDSYILFPKDIYVIPYSFYKQQDKNVILHTLRCVMNKKWLPGCMNST